MDCWAAERFGRASVYWDVIAVKQSQDAESIVGCMFEGGVAMDCGDAEKFQSWVSGCEEDGEGILRYWSIDVSCFDGLWGNMTHVVS